MLAGMATIASRVLAELRKPSRNDVIDLAAFREAKKQSAPVPEEAFDSTELGEEDLEGTPAEFRFWMDVFRHLAGMGFGLLGLRHMRTFAERIEDTEERYMPGGPPMSPLTDSFHSLWSVADLSAGLKKESLATVAIAVARTLGMPKEPLSAWQTIADSYAGIYRILKREGHVAFLEELITGEHRSATTADPIPGAPGDLWWVRLLPPALPEHSYWTTMGTPYVFAHSEADELWRGYLERQLARLPEKKRAIGYRRLMKQGASPDAWFEFILDGYAGQRGPAVLLQGVPDLPETLPLSPEHGEPGEFEEFGDDDAPPLHRLRLKLLRVVAEMDLSDAAEDDFFDAREGLAKLPASDPEDWTEPERILYYAYVMFECRDDAGRRALDLLDRDSLDSEEQRELSALEAGWFSLFEVLRVKVDEAIEVRDIVRRRRFWITERSATRSLSVGDCIGCWITIDGDQPLIEGAVAHVPHVWAPMAIDAIRQVVDTMRLRQPSMHWRKRQGHLVPWVAAIVALITSRRPPTTLVNQDGDTILQSQAHYLLKDRGGVLQLLRARRELRETSPECFAWVDDKQDVLIGEIELDDKALCIVTNSKERLAMLRGWLEAIAEDRVQHQGTSHQDPLSSQYDTQADNPFETAEPLPPELRGHIASMMHEKLAEMLDTKVPLLGNKTPRQAVRTARGRDDVTSWLLGQERINAANTQMGDLLDTSFMWSELGLVHPDKRG